MDSLIDVLSKSDKFKALTDAIKIAGMVDILSSDGPYTILAPTDEAVAQVPKSVFSALLENRDELIKSVKYHIIEGNLNSRKLLMKFKSATTVEVSTMEGQKVIFRVSGILKRHFMVDDATIISTDIKASNGFIHAIDAVLFRKKLP